MTVAFNLSFPLVVSFAPARKLGFGTHVSYAGLSLLSYLWIELRIQLVRCDVVVSRGSGWIICTLNETVPIAFGGAVVGGGIHFDQRYHDKRLAHTLRRGGGAVREQHGTRIRDEIRNG